MLILQTNPQYTYLKIAFSTDSVDKHVYIVVFIPASYIQIKDEQYIFVKQSFYNSKLSQNPSSQVLFKIAPTPY